MTQRTNLRESFYRRQREAVLEALADTRPAERARELLSDGLSDHEAAAVVGWAPNDVRRAVAEEPKT